MVPNIPEGPKTPPRKVSGGETGLMPPEGHTREDQYLHGDYKEREKTEEKRGG